MKILLYVNTKQNLIKSNYLGGIEVLNYDLYNFLKGKHDTTLTNSLKKNITNKKWDLIISSNDAKIFNSINATNKNANTYLNINNGLLEDSPGISEVLVIFNSSKASFDAAETLVTAF